MVKRLKLTFCNTDLEAASANKQDTRQNKGMSLSVSSPSGQILTQLCCTHANPLGVSVQKLVIQG
jgi:hypothetical protein